MSELRYQINLDAITTQEKQALTHNIHPYPAKFIPQIPGSLLDYLCIPNHSIVLDPFCGSGTTLLEAAIRGFDAVGIDSNPIATLISKVKCTPLTGEELIRIDKIISMLDTFDAMDSTKITIPEFLNRDHWFQRNMQNELGFIRYLINTVDDPLIVDFLSTAFSAIIVKASNQESDTRWRAKNKNLPDGFAIAEFKKKVSDMCSRINQLSQYPMGAVSVKTQDSRDLGCISDNTVTCAITSPPYMNSFDYYLYHKLRMYWLGFDHYTVQEEEIGSRNKHSDDGRGIDSYVDSIFQVVEQVHRKIMPCGYFCVVIGDSIYKNQLVQMDSVYGEIASRAGFITKEIFSFDQRKYTRAFTPNLKTTKKQSHIMIFQKV